MESLDFVDNDVVVGEAVAHLDARTVLEGGPAGPPDGPNRKRRVVARLETTTRGFDSRYIVTSLEGEPRRLYEGTYCARGQAENLIKQHKAQLASDRT